MTDLELSDAYESYGMCSEDMYIYTLLREFRCMINEKAKPESCQTDFVATGHETSGTD